MNKKKTTNMIIALCITSLFFGTLFLPSISGVDDGKEPTLPRFREGEIPYNPDQSLEPYAIKIEQPKDVPTSGVMASPPEYGPTQGVLYTFYSGYQADVVTDLVVALTENDDCDEIAYVVVSSSSQQNTATSMFSSAGANLSKVEFIIESFDSIWMRDYGPHFVWHNGTLAIVDSHYYQSRDVDNFIPTALGDDHFNIQTFDMGLYYSGGNFQPGPDRSAFVSALVTNDNPSSEGFNESFIAELYQTYQGIDNLHIMPQLPSSVDGTGHIDMWMQIVDEDTVIISKFKPGSNPTAIQITDNAVPYMEGLGFEVYRTPAWNVGSTHYTYTNAFRVNDRYFTSYYGDGNPSYADEDAEALANYTAAAGTGVEIIPIDCYGIIPAAGAIHCIVMQVPRYIDTEPSVQVLWPDGGEILVGGTMQTITWSATDTYNRDIPQIDLYYSLDDGDTFEFIDTTINSGSYQWTIPDEFSEDALIKIVATADDMDQGEGISTTVFTIAPGTQTVYDFSTNAGVDRFGWGYMTSNWNSYIDGVRMPVTQEIDTLTTNAYNRIAYSDATGGESDSNRYISPNPSYYQESTHVFEFTIYEDTADIDSIELFWEGFADYCTQVELYIWNYAEEQWSDGQGLLGQNRFADNWAGLREGYLTCQIYESIDQYINEEGQLTILVYAERGPNSYAPTNPTYHDYLSVTISSIQKAPTLAYDPTSYDFHSMYINDTDATTFEIWNDGIGIVNYTLTETCSWVEVLPLEGNSTGEHDTISVTVNTTGLTPGSYHCDIAIDSDAGTGTFGVDVDVFESGTPIEDINQSTFDRGFPIRHTWDGDWGAAQSFKPILGVYTSVDIYMRKFGTPEFNLTVELREGHPEGILLDTLIFTPGEIASSWQWLDINFSDTVVTPGNDYFVVLPPAPSTVTTSFGYEWGYAFGNQYDDGSFWFTRDGGDLWRDLPTMYDFSFKTYGYD
jgi:agmatine deiminase